MPELTTLLLFTVGALALVAIPGPNHVFIVARSIEQGRNAGFASAFGVETATLAYALGAGGAGARLRASAGFARRRRYVAGSVYLALAVAALVGGRRRAS